MIPQLNPGSLAALAGGVLRDAEFGDIPPGVGTVLDEGLPIDGLDALGLTER